MSVGCGRLAEGKGPSSPTGMSPLTLPLQRILEGIVTDALEDHEGTVSTGDTVSIVSIAMSTIRRSLLPGLMMVPVTPFSFRQPPTSN